MSWKESFLVIAHRGASAYEPENTLAAFKKAIDLGADAIELDVRRSREGIPVVLHDEDLKRVAGIEKKVSELTVDELKKLTVFGKEPIPTLDEVLANFGNITTIFIEVKDEGIEEKIAESIKNHKVYDSVLIISFNYSVLAKIKQLIEKVEIGLLTYKYPLPTGEALKLRAFAILPRYNIISPRTVKEVHSKGLKVYTWTLNDVPTALKVIGYGVDGIATDDPALKRAVRKQQKLTMYFG
uniref:Glycerophosphodiester phosphodiesterase n=1 Tax=Ignisphaera aggregans TaxID=334771 RepID=A0A7C2VFZ8_9CREN